MILSELITKFFIARSLFVSVHTLEWYHYNLDPLACILGDRSIEVITPDDLTTFLASQSSNRSKSTLQGFHAALAALFNFADEQGHLAINPMKSVKAPRRQRRRRIPGYFSDAEIRALLGACNNRRDRAILLTLLDTGLRRDELLQLDVKNLDLDGGDILVRNGKGGKDRYVPIGQRCTAALREYLLDHPRSGPLFYNRGRKRLQNGGLRSMLLRLKEQAGLECRVHTHKFRHTFARNYLKRGDLESLREILGHEDIRLTAQVYGSFTRESLKEKHRRCSPVDNNNWEQPHLT